MNLDLSEFVGTLCLGGGIVLGFAILMRTFVGIELASVIERLDGKLLGNSFILTMAAFALGMVAEDMSDHYVDTDGQFFQRNLGFVTESEIRTGVLLGRTSKIVESQRSAVTTEAEWENLAKAYARLGLFSVQDQEFGTEVEKVILDGSKLNRSVNVHRNISGLVNSVYYQAKNTVYREDNYFKELGLIQNRIDFARSLSVISVLFVLTTLTFFVMTVVKILYLSFTSGDDKRSKIPTLTISTAILSMVFAGVFLAARDAYAAEEAEFDRRVFGYYASMKQEQASKEAAAKSATTPP